MTQVGDVIQTENTTLSGNPETWQWGVVESKDVKNGTLTVRAGKKTLTTVSKYDLWKLGELFFLIFFFCFFFLLN